MGAQTQGHPRYGGPNISRCHITNISRTASRTSRATVARTLALWRHDSHLAYYRITHIARYGGTHSLTHSHAAISRESAPRVPHHEHSALRWHALSHCHIKDVRAMETQMFVPS